MEITWIIIIVEGVLLLVCIGTLFRAWWLIGMKNGALSYYIGVDQARIRALSQLEKVEREKKELEDKLKALLQKDTSTKEKDSKKLNK